MDPNKRKCLYICHSLVSSEQCHTIYSIRIPQILLNHLCANRGYIWLSEWFLQDQCASQQVKRQMQKVQRLKTKENNAALIFPEHIQLSNHNFSIWCSGCLLAQFKIQGRVEFVLNGISPKTCSSQGLNTILCTPEGLLHYWWWSNEEIKFHLFMIHVPTLLWLASFLSSKIKVLCFADTQSSAHAFPLQYHQSLSTDGASGSYRACSWSPITAPSSFCLADQSFIIIKKNSF